MTNGPEEQGPIIRDKRRIDPETGELRVPADQPTGQSAGRPATEASAEAGGSVKEDNGVAKIKAKLDERTNDLQRVQAEYANYRKRVERDRVAVREQALANVLIELLPVLDDIGRARDHDELTGDERGGAAVLVDAGPGVEPLRRQPGERAVPVAPDEDLAAALLRPALQPPAGAVGSDRLEHPYTVGLEAAHRAAEQGGT